MQANNQPIALGTGAGKVILCGEHSVVYGYPAIAVPLSSLRARVTLAQAETGSGVLIHAPDIKYQCSLRHAAKDAPLALAVRMTLAALKQVEPDVIMTIKSDLPVASGLGSGAAVSAAIVRSFSTYTNTSLSLEQISAITYEVEKVHHGNPSGLDNTTVVYEKPVFFERNKPPVIFRIGKPFQLVIANSGIASSTKEVVEDVRHHRQNAQAYYDMLFTCIGAISKAARDAVEQGAIRALGTLLDENHELLVKVGVSLPQLDVLVKAARDAGAYGAKLTGGGQGGNIIALVDTAHVSLVEQAVRAAGATQVWHTKVE